MTQKCPRILFSIYVFHSLIFDNVISLLLVVVAGPTNRIRKWYETFDFSKYHCYTQRLYLFISNAKFMD